MPEVNLTTLSGPELRRLLDTTRERGAAALSYQILQEMAARRENGRRRRRRTDEPRIITVDLGDPLERHAEDDDVPPMPAALSAEPEPEFKLGSRPRGVWHDDPQPAPPPRPAWRPPSVPAPKPGRATVGFAAGIAGGLALGWWAAGATHETPAPRPPVQPAPRVMTVALAQPAAPAPPPPAVATPEPTPEAPPEPVAETTPEPEAPAPAVTANEVARDAVAEAEAEVAAAPDADPCASQPTPADRTICGHRKLQRLQRELREAYADALAAHEERSLLRERQLAWAEARNEVADPARLARIYEQRIRKLESATAEARRLR